MENKSVFNCFLNCVMLLFSRMFLGSLFHRVGPAQANARRPKRSRLTLGTSSSNPPAERSERGGVWRRSSAARYSGVPLYMALCTSTSSLKSIRFLTGNQCNCRSIFCHGLPVAPPNLPDNSCRRPLDHFQTVHVTITYAV